MINPSYVEAIQRPDVPLHYWVEIEGLPYCFGNFRADARAFAGRPEEERFEGILPWMTNPPTSFDQEVDVLEAAASVGQMSIDLLDLGGGDSGLPPLANLLGLAAAMTAEPLTLLADFYTGSSMLFAEPSPWVDSWPTEGHLWVGKETLRFSRTKAVFNIVGQGRFRSKPADHGAGSLLTQYPRSIGQRMIWVWYVAGDFPRTKDPTEIVGAATLRFVGTVQSASRLPGGIRGFRLGCDSIDRRVNGFAAPERAKTLFDKPYMFTLKQGIAGRAEDGTFYVDGDGEDALDGYAVDARGNPVDDWVRIENRGSAITFGSLSRFNRDRGRGFRFFVRVDDELMNVEWDSNRPYHLHILHRGLWGTKRQPHEPDAEGQEVFPLVPVTPGGYPVSASPLYSLPNLDGDPVELALALITSTGKGTNGPYDVLPADWGMGVPVEWIDLAECERSRDRVCAPRVAGIIEEPIQLREWLQTEIYKPLGLFPLSRFGGLYAIRRLDLPLPDEVPLTIDSSDIIRDKLPEWDANLSSAIGAVRFSFDKRLDGEFDTVRELRHPDADILYDGACGTQEIESSLLRDNKLTGSETALHFPELGSMAGGSGFAESEAGRWKAFWERPAPVVDVTVKFGRQLIEPGDHVALASEAVPNLITGQWGANQPPENLFTVIKKQIEDKKGTVALTLLQTGVRAARFRRIAPSAVVATVHSDNTFTVAGQGQGCAAPGERDLDWFTPGSDEAASWVEVWAPDLSEHTEPTRVAATDPESGFLGLADLLVMPSGRPVEPGDIVMLANWTATDEKHPDKARFAFLADPTGTLDGQPPHEYVP